MLLGPTLIHLLNSSSEREREETKKWSPQSHSLPQHWAQMDSSPISSLKGQRNRGNEAPEAVVPPFCIPLPTVTCFLPTVPMKSLFMSLQNTYYCCQSNNKKREKEKTQECEQESVSLNALFIIILPFSPPHTRLSGCQGLELLHENDGREMFTQECVGWNTNVVKQWCLTACRTGKKNSAMKETNS